MPCFVDGPCGAESRSNSIALITTGKAPVLSPGETWCGRKHHKTVRKRRSLPSMGDARYSDELSRTPSIPSSTHEAKSFVLANDNPLKFEQKRLDTFANWPEAAPIEANKLAKAGFYYSGTGLEVTCFSCKGSISNWDYGDKAVVKHRTMNPQCDFILQKSNNVSLVAREGSLNSPPSSLSQQSVSNSSLVNGHQTPQSVRSQSATSIQPTTSFRDSSAVQNEEEPALRDQKTWQSFSLLLHEDERQKTYKGWPVTFVKAEDLARTGFFFLRDRDRVQCVFCNGIVGDWEHGDVPSTEHHRHFPNCPFLKGYDVGNVPINRAGGASQDSLPAQRQERSEDQCGPRWQHQHHMHNVPEKGRNSRNVQSTCNGTMGITRHTGPKHPNYATVEARLRTYMNWPEAIPQTRLVLAEAGFYYAGISDHVRCFYCDGGLRNWEPEDEPWTEHARWFGNCSFLLLVKGTTFVNEAKVLRPPILPEDAFVSPTQAPLAEYLSHGFGQQVSINSLMQTEPVKAVTDKGIPPEFVRGALLKLLQQNGAQLPSAEMLYNTSMDSIMLTPVVESVLETSMPRELIREAIEKRLQQTGRPFTEADALYDACVVIESQVIERFPGSEEPMSVTSYGAPAANPSSVCNGTMPALPVGQTRSTTELEKRTKELALEDANSKETRVCKICMDEELGVVFLPCGHLIACVKCAPSLTDCPYCRKPIRGTVRTYFS